jgi:hypothetical protein
MFLGWLPLKIVQRMEFHAELWLPCHRKELFLNIFFLKNQREKAKIFSMKHLLVGVYQVCSNKSPGVKIGPSPGGH